MDARDLQSQACELLLSIGWEEQESRSGKRIQLKTIGPRDVRASIGPRFTTFYERFGSLSLRLRRHPTKDLDATEAAGRALVRASSVC